MMYRSSSRKSLDAGGLATLLLAALTIPALWLTGCGSGVADPHLILIIMDTTRQDHLGCYGRPDAATVTLDSLAAQGVRFDSVITATPVTGPAIATLLSGCLPPAHGMRDNARFTLNPELGLLAEVFAEAGYRTGAVVGGMPIHGQFGYARGFQAYDDRFAEDDYPTYNSNFLSKAAILNESERRAEAVTDRALAWLGQTGRAGPVFLMAHYFDPHGPYDPPPGFADSNRDAYSGEIAYMDAQIGRLLAGAREILGRDADIRVVAIGDHGEGLMDHDEATHGFFVYDTTIRVPLIFCGAGAAGGRLVEASVRSMDVAGTICAWLDRPAPSSSRGVDFSAALSGGPVPAACDTAYAETFLTQYQHGWSPLQAVRTDAWKWIMAPQPELYDLHADPQELQNVIAGNPGIVRALREGMQDVLIDAHGQAQEIGATVNAENSVLTRQLDALGYVSKSGERQLKPDYSLPDPKDGVRTWNIQMERKSALSTARQMVERGHPDRAYRLLNRANSVSPLNEEEAAFLDRVIELLQAGGPE